MSDSDIAIKVENLSKQYRIGQIGTGTLSHDLNRWWAALRGKEDPYLKIGETNDRASKGNSQYVWSLKDINFEVKQGEVLGIIGKNGAGKSTLLKVLSRVTGPTTGRVLAEGRIGALLEVGTGFHPELTGRENIFLNGAILGMKKNEISSRLDEIIDFSGCERYIDTPVKRYSSGMKVRLAFAVAAFLEPEILIVDEVLAVGDAEFQKKAIGKMREVSKGDGRTVLFVSHNMEAIRNLCTSAVQLKNGMIEMVGDPEEVIRHYLLQSGLHRLTYQQFEVNPDLPISLVEIELLKNDKKADGSDFDVHDKISLSITYEVTAEQLDFFSIYTLVKREEIELFGLFDSVPDNAENLARTRGKYNAVFDFPSPLLKPGQHTISFFIGKQRTPPIQEFHDAIAFNVELMGANTSHLPYTYKRKGLIAVKGDWHINRL